MHIEGFLIKHLFYYCVYILFPPVCCNKKCFVSEQVQKLYLDSFIGHQRETVSCGTQPQYINNQNVITSRLYSLILICSIIQQSVTFCNHGCMESETVFKEVAS